MSSFINKYEILSKRFDSCGIRVEQMWNNRFVLKEGLSKDEILLAVAKYLQVQFISESVLTLFDDMLRPLSSEVAVALIDELIQYGVIEFVKPWGIHPYDKSTFCELKPTKKLDAFCRSGVSPYIAPNIDSEVKLILTHKLTGELLINDTFLICKTNAGSINDRTISFLIENPNHIFERAELEEKKILRVEDKEDKDFHIILADIGMKGDFKQLFFGKGLTKNTICLTNPVYQADFDRVGIKYIDFRNLIKQKDRKRPEDD